MVKLQKGKGPGSKNSKPRPLFPPGELPLFGPPPAYARRPAGPPPPPPPRPRPLPLGYGPPPMRLPPPLVGPPVPPRPPMPLHPMRRRGPPGPQMPPPPLMGLPHHRPMPPPLHPFMCGPPRRPPGPGLPPPFRGRIDKIPPNRRFKPNNKVKKKKNNNFKKPENKTEEQADDDLLTGPWIDETIKAEIDIMTELKNVADEKKEGEEVNKYDEQKRKVEELAQAARTEHLNANVVSEVMDTQAAVATQEEPMVVEPEKNGTSAD